jgi:hypothetical protein
MHQRLCKLHTIEVVRSNSNLCRSYSPAVVKSCRQAELQAGKGLPPGYEFAATGQFGRSVSLAAGGWQQLLPGVRPLCEPGGWQQQQQGMPVLSSALPYVPDSPAVVHCL